MGRTTSALLPATERLAADLGERLRLARKRRKLTTLQVAERAGMAPMTLRAVEQGSASATFGAYLAVMQVLGLQADLSKMAAEDTVGRAIQDASLERPRLSRLNAGERNKPAKTGAYLSPRSASSNLPLQEVREDAALLPTSPMPPKSKGATELLGLLKRPPTKRK